MHSDEKSQEKQFKYVATIASGKLLLEINDGITYRGEIEVSPYYDMQELKALFERGDVQILIKTNSKMMIKLAILRVELLSQESNQIKELRGQIQTLERRLEVEGLWMQEDLSLTAPFDMNYVYRVYTNAGFSCLSTSVSNANIFFLANQTHINVANGNRRNTSNGWAVTKMMKKKV